MSNRRRNTARRKQYFYSQRRHQGGDNMNTIEVLVKAVEDLSDRLYKLENNYRLLESENDKLKNAKAYSVER